MTGEYGLDAGYAYVTCRDLRHAWLQDATVGSPEGEVSRTLTCSRCGTVRTETYVISRRGGFISKTGHKYKYPEGYLLKRPGVTAGQTAQQARLIGILSRLRRT